MRQQENCKIKKQQRTAKKTLVYTVIQNCLDSRIQNKLWERSKSFCTLLNPSINTRFKMSSKKLTSEDPLA